MIAALLPPITTFRAEAATIPDADWTITMDVVDADALVNPPYSSGRTVKLNVSFAAKDRDPGAGVDYVTNETIDYDKQYSIYVLDAINAGPIYNAINSTASTPVFLIDGRTLVTMDGKMYNKITFHFNPALKDVEAALTNATFSSTLTVKYITGQQVVPHPFAFEADEKVYIDEIKIVEPPPPTPTGSVTLAKAVAGIYHSTDSGASYALVTNELTYVQPGDIVRYRITMSDTLANYGGTGNPWPTYTGLTDTLPAGLTGLGVGEKTLPTPAGPASANPAGWVNTSGQTWTYTGFEYNTQTESSKEVYFYARVDSSVTSGTLINTAKVDTKEATASVIGTVSGRPIVVDPNEIYDVALSTYWVNYGTNAGTYASIQELKPVSKDVTAAINLYNQGTRSIDNIKVALYLPAGITFVPPTGTTPEYIPDDGNFGWTQTATSFVVPDQVADFWVPVTRWEKNIRDFGTIAAPKGTLAPALSKYFTVSLHVEADYDTPQEDLIFFAEVVSFEEVVTDDYGAPEHFAGYVRGDPDSDDTDSTVDDADYDSWPDNDPFNDLWVPLLGEYRGFTLNGNDHRAEMWYGTKKADVSKTKDFNSKELDGRIVEHAKQGTGATTGSPVIVDEDDYDFTFVVVTRPVPGEDYQLKELDKKRLPATAATTSVRAMIGTHGYEAPTAEYYGYEALPDDGLITNVKSYIVYENVINAGEHTADNPMLGVEFTDTLPEGLKWAQFNHYEVGVGRRYAMQILVYSNTVTVDGKQEVITSGATSLAFNSETHHTDMATLMGAGLDLSDKAINLHIAFSNNDRTITATADSLNSVVIVIRTVAVLDANYPLVQGTVYQNTSTLTYTGESLEDTEDTFATFEFDGASAYVRKQILNGSTPVTLPNVVSGPDADVKYRIQFRTAGTSTFAAGEINRIDDIAAGALAAGAGFTFDGTTAISWAETPSGAGAVGDYIAATYADGKLTITNADKTAMPSGGTINIDFTVSYTGLQPGRVVKNTVGTTVTTLVPLGLTVNKVGESSQPLSGAQFELYYASESGTYSVADPVRESGTTGDVITLGTSAHPGYDFSFVPKAYAAQSVWHIAFAETVAPSPYHAGKVFFMDVVKDANGNLSWVVPAASSDRVTGLSGGAVTFINDETVDANGKIEVNKTWGVGEAPHGDARFFVYANTDALKSEKELTKSGGTYSISGTSKGIAEGKQYTLVEYSPVGFGASGAGWELTGVVNKGGTDYNRYEYGTPITAVATDVQSGYVIDVTNIVASTAQLEITKSWPGLPITVPATPAPISRFFLEAGEKRYELTRNGLVYTSPVVLSGAYTLIEYAPVGWSPSSGGLTWTSAGRETLGSVEYDKFTAAITLAGGATAVKTELNVTNSNVPTASVTLGGQKTVAVTGSGEAPEQSFGFTLTQVESDVSTTAVLSGIVRTATVATSGAGNYPFTFPVIDGLVDGTYYFLVTEDTVSAANWANTPSAPQRVTVVVSVGVPTTTYSPTATGSVFTNTYTPPDAYLYVKKVFPTAEGRELVIFEITGTFSDNSNPRYVYFSKDGGATTGFMALPTNAPAHSWLSSTPVLVPGVVAGNTYLIDEYVLDPSISVTNYANYIDATQYYHVDQPNSATATADGAAALAAPYVITNTKTRLTVEKSYGHTRTGNEIFIVRVQGDFYGTARVTNGTKDIYFTSDGRNGTHNWNNGSVLVPGVLDGKTYTITEFVIDEDITGSDTEVSAASYYQTTFKVNDTVSTNTVTADKTTAKRVSVDNKWYDVALQKWVAGVSKTAAIATGLLSEPGDEPVEVAYGDYVTYAIRVINQSYEPVIITGVVDYIPDWLELTDDVIAVNANWDDADSPVLRYTGAGIPLAAQGDSNGDDSAIVYIVLRVKAAGQGSNPADPMASPIINYAEISAFTDANGNTVPDIDSTPDDLNNDGTENGNPVLKDNIVDESRKAGKDSADEDDHDIAKIIIATPTTSATIKGLKAVSVVAGGTPASGTFSFTLKELNSATVGDFKNGDVAIGTQTTTEAGGTFSFSLASLASGTYYYQIEEVTGSAGGWTYDAVKYVVTVEVGYAPGFGVTYTYTYPASYSDANPPVFTNSYSVTGTSIELAAKKAIAGSDAELEDYDFAVYVGDDTTAIPVATGTSDEDGDIVFDPAINYTAAGTYTYTIKELWEPDAGWTAPATQTVTVYVTDNGDGTLSATPSYGSTPQTFTNTYNITGTASAALTAKKTVTGAVLVEDQFSFGLYAATFDGTEYTEDSLIETKTNDASGNIEFTLISYTAANIGEHYYVIKETSPGGGGWTVDSSVYGVTVTVADDGEGGIEAAVSYSSTTAPTFANVYAATGSVTLAAKKAISGASAAFDGYDFAVYAGTDTTGTPVATGTSLADGSITFAPAITYNVAGTYTYTIAETTALGTGWTAPANQTATVNVVDNGDGTLTATPTYETPPTFTNTYNPPYVPPTPTPPTPTPSETPTPTPEETPTPTPSETPTPTPRIPVTPTPPVTPNDDGSYIEFDDDGSPLGEWRYDEDLGEWIFDEFPPLGAIDTGDSGLLLWAVVALVAGAVFVLTGKKKVK
jgi:pilin isopeptide linkage protein